MRRLSLLAVALLVAGCAQFASLTESKERPHAKLGQWGVELANLDSNVRPGDNFFRYVNGKWLDSAQIPEDRSSVGSFVELAILSEERMNDIVGGLKARNDLNVEEAKVRDLYDDYTNVARIEELGLGPVQADLDRIAGVKTHDDVARIMGDVAMGTDGVSGIFFGADDKNPDVYKLFLYQSGLGMPDRDYYLLDNEAIVATREAYKTYLRTMLEIAGAKNAKARAGRIFTLETEIAKVHWPVAERRDADKVYNPMTMSELKRFAPKFPWNAFFDGLQVPKSPSGERTVIILEKSAFPKLASVFAKTPVAVWRDYLTVSYLHAHAPLLPKHVDDADFAFYGTALSGRSQQLAREKRAVQMLDRNIGEAVGKIYVAQYFPPEAKAKAKELVSNLLKTYDARIRALDWMSPETKEKAIAKVASFTVKIGYPDKWRDYSALEIRPGDLVGNMARAADYRWQYNMARLDGPVDKSEWGMRPQTVNAYYNPGFNEIVFPAAILQPPFFDPHADDAVNYGGIGAVIGHEIGHGFDDQGSKYDAKGVLNNWWTDADRKRFEERTTTLVAQYGEYVPLEGLHVNGPLTLGENIGDLGGVSVAHAAYKLSRGGKDAPVVDGLTGDQRFFLAFGQIWRAKYRDGALRQRVLSDPHSPPEFRANGSVRNVDAWYAAFDVKEGDKYYLPPDQRVSIW